MTVPIEAYCSQVCSGESNVRWVQDLNFRALEVSFGIMLDWVQPYLPYVDVEVADNAVLVSDTFSLFIMLIYM